MVSKMFRTRSIAAGIAVLALGLAACSSGDSGDGETAGGDGGGGGAITVGFSQVGSESGWRAANTKSIQDALTAEAGFDLSFSDAQQKQENQIQAIRSYIAQGVDVHRVLPGGRVRLGQRARGGQGRRHPGHPDRPRGRLRGHVALRDVHRLRLRRGGQAHRRLGLREPRHRADQRRRAAGHHGLRAGDRPQDRASRTPSTGRPEHHGDRLRDRQLHARRGQDGHGGLPPGRTPTSTWCTRTTTTWAWAPSRRSRRPARCPARTSRSSRIDGVKDGMTALADGKINYIVECNPLLGPDLAEIIKTLERRRHRRAAHRHPGRARSTRTGAQAVLPDRQY